MVAIAAVGVLFATPFPPGQQNKPPISQSPDRTVPEESLDYFDAGVVDGTDDTVEKTRKLKVLTLTEENTIEYNAAVDYASALSVVKKIKAAQNKPVDRIYLLVTSPGGSVIAGAMILEAIQGSKVPIDTVCVVLCASMGAQIHSVGAKRYMTDKSILMYHPAAGGFEGEFDTMISRMNFLNRYVNKMDAYIAQRAGIPYAEFKKRIRNEYWLDAVEATSERFNDGVVYLDDGREPKADFLFLVPDSEEKSPAKGFFGGH